MNLFIFSFKMIRMTLAVFSVIVIIEIAFRSYYFGSESIYNFGDYSSRNILSSKFVEVDPNPNIRYKLSASTNGFYKATQLSINSLGFRGSNAAIDKPEGIYRIALLGSSIDMGAGISYKQTYSYLVEQRLNKIFPFRIEIQNHAVSGYRALQIEASFWDHVDKFKPDLILLPVHVEHFQNKFKPYSLKELDIFCFKIRCHFRDFFSLTALRKAARDFTQNLRKIGWFGRKDHWQPIDKRENHGNKINTVREKDIFKRFIINLKAADYDVVILRLPSLKGLSYLQKSDELNEIWTQWLSQVNPALAIDTVSEIQPKISFKDKIYMGDVHPNARVNALYAAAIFQSLLPFVDKAISDNDEKPLQQK